MPRSRWIPLAAFAVIAVFLGIGLTLNPREVPSPLIGKAAPHFALPALHAGEQVITPGSLRGRVWLLNVWASWCGSCRVDRYKHIGPLTPEIIEGKLMPLAKKLAGHG